jgi:hypothetical protein
MLPGAETGDGLSRAGSVQIASRRFSQNSLYRQPLRLFSPDIRYLEKRLGSPGYVCKALPPLALDVIAVGRILSGGRPSRAARKIPTRGGASEQSSSEGGGLRVVGFVDARFPECPKHDQMASGTSGKRTVTAGTWTLGKRIATPKFDLRSKTTNGTVFRMASKNRIAWAGDSK